LHNDDTATTLEASRLGRDERSCRETILRIERVTQMEYERNCAREGRHLAPLAFAE
jgi:hypothetical protein